MGKQVKKVLKQADWVYKAKFLNNLGFGKHGMKLRFHQNYKYMYHKLAGHRKSW